VWQPTDPKTHPDFADMSPARRTELEQRFTKRVGDFERLEQARAKLTQDHPGWTIDAQGFFRGPNGEAVTGDHDLFEIFARDPDTGNKIPAPPAVKEAVLRDLGHHPGWRQGVDTGISNGTFDAQHGAHADLPTWDPKYVASEISAIDRRVVDAAQPGGQPLLAIESGRGPYATYSDIESADLVGYRQGLQTAEQQRNELYESIRARGKETLLEQASARAEALRAGGEQVPNTVLTSTLGPPQQPATSSSLWWHTTPEERSWQDQVARLAGNTTQYSGRDPATGSGT
jgi:hypothetical protein